MILDIDVDIGENEKIERILTVFLFGVFVAILVRFVESVYKTTLLQL